MKSQKPLRNTEMIISIVLQVGVVVSVATILVGLMLFFTSKPNTLGPYNSLTTAGFSFPHTLGAIQASIVHGEGTGIIELGVLLLILTPVLRVAASILLFQRAKDKPMMLVTLGVLLLLAGSFIIGMTAK